MWLRHVYNWCWLIQEMMSHLHSEVLRHQQINICAGLRSTRHTNIPVFTNECFVFLCGKNLVGTDNALPYLNWFGLVVNWWEPIQKGLKISDKENWMSIKIWWEFSEESLHGLLFDLKPSPSLASNTNLSEISRVLVGGLSGRFQFIRLLASVWSVDFCL